MNNIQYHIGNYSNHNKINIMIPNYQGFMKPIMTILADGQVHTSRECIQRVGDILNLTDEERVELLPSKTQGVVANRFHWAHIYLERAGLVVSPSRGKYQITDEGKNLISENPTDINNAFLKRYPSFVEFIEHGKPGSGKKPVATITVSSSSTDDSKTPDEVMNECYTQLRSQLADELLDMVIKQSPAFFEALVISLLESMGYGSGKITGRSGDGGIDGIIDADKLGIDVIHIQAKRYQKGNNIGRPVLQSFVGALAGQNSTKGVFITTSDYTKDAIDYNPSGVKIVKLNGKQLAQLMIDYNLGVSTREVYEIKKIDSDFFEE